MRVASMWTEGMQQVAGTAVLEALRSPALVVDPQLEVVVANAAAYELLGRPASETVGHPLLSLVTAVAAEARAEVVQAVRRGEAWELLTGTASPAGSVPVLLRGGPLPGTAGVVVALVPALDPAGHRPSASDADLTAELEQALHGDAVVLHFQPVVRLHDRRPVALEALVRWQHPSRGFLAPAQFLAAADHPATAGALGRRVLRQACHAAAGWARELPGRSPVQVTVNLSERQLLQPGTVTLVREALAVAGCPPDRLMIEVAEVSLLADPDAAAAALSALKDVGVEIAVDDLGTGSSPLSYLKRFPVDVVKIDRSLIAGLGRDYDQSAVVASLLSLAQAMSVRCVAEGVETADQFAVLRRLGCELGQGYLFSRAMGSHAAGEWLARSAGPRSSVIPRQQPEVPAALMARALELQAEGASLHTIAARLNIEGHRRAGGRRWHHTSVAQLIGGHLFPDLAR